MCLNEKVCVYKILYYKVYIPRHRHTLFWVLPYVQNKKRNTKWAKESIQKPNRESGEFANRNRRTLRLPPPSCWDTGAQLQERGHGSGLPAPFRGQSGIKTKATHRRWLREREKEPGSQQSPKGTPPALDTQHAT